LNLYIFCNKNAWHVHKPTIRESLPTQFSSNLRGSLVQSQLTHSTEGSYARVFVFILKLGRVLRHFSFRKKIPLINEEGEQEGARWLYCWRDSWSVM